MVTFRFHQYQIVRRTLPTESDEHPKIYHMKLWATNEVRAKSKFWISFIQPSGVSPSLLVSARNFTRLGKL
ncbi:hypothetical protein SO802_000419 [Lithocarpus litseifolius]|uniref:Ribosomal protein 50S-L18Ae/60S-L20/60S-L18A domain-containing protein n=1 Tax=Lithocarpus litseifolius TaxID=425828 RepID=A0AAW2DRI6_9ROSI